MLGRIRKERLDSEGKRERSLKRRQRRKVVIEETEGRREDEKEKKGKGRSRKLEGEEGGVELEEEKRSQRLVAIGG